MALAGVVGGTTGSKRVLVCDDERHQVRLIQTWLEAGGYTVAPCFSGADALRLLEESSFDLVILDVMMPGLDGFEVLKTIRRDRRFENLVVIMLTAKTQDADVFAGYHYGADLYLTKPCSRTDLLSMLG